jgi:hypothetical protein
MDYVCNITSKLQEVYECLDIYYGAILYDQDQDTTENILLLKNNLQQQDFPVAMFPMELHGRLFMVPKNDFDMFLGSEFRDGLTLVVALTDEVYKWASGLIKTKNELKERIYIIKI